MKRQIYLFRDVLPNKVEEDVTKPVGKNNTGGIRVLPELPTNTKMSKDNVIEDPRVTESRKNGKAAEVAHKKRRKVRVRKTFPKKDKTAEGVVLKTPVEIKKAEDDYDYPMLEIF